MSLRERTRPGLGIIEQCLAYSIARGVTMEGRDIIKALDEVLKPTEPPAR
jgi:hypothetical protein